MKKLFFLVLATFGSYYAVSQNLVLNPGFESWINDSKPDGWSHVENCSRDISFVHSGSYSCKHTGGSSTSDLGQSVSVVAGKQYMLSFYYLTGAGTTGNGSRIWCYWKDASGNSITDIATDAVIRPSKYLKSDTWQQFTITVEAPGEAVVFYLEVRTNTNSIIYWDDFLFEEVTPTGAGTEKTSDINIFPNPANEKIEISGIHGSCIIDIIDMKGNIIIREYVKNEEEKVIPIQHLSPGSYLVRLIGQSTNTVKRVIKR